MKITLKDGSVREYSEAMTVNDIAFDIAGGLGRAACAGEVDGEVVDLRTTIDKDCTLNILTFKDEAGKAAYRHTASHVLAEAVKNLFPEAKLAIGPSIDDGFYYDFDSEPFSREDLDKIEKEMKKIIKSGARLERFTLPREDAIKYMEDRNEPYKVELIKDLQQKTNVAVIFITHDLGVVANVADRVAVMYAGRVCEIGTSNEVFYNSCHPYTWGLLASMPDLDTSDEQLYAIPGTPPNLLTPPKGDAFAFRSEYALNIDFEEQPPMFKVSDTHYAATWLLHEQAPKVTPPAAVLRLRAKGGYTHE